ncbi:unnamed protein product [Clonostachys rhizophaga]|uniref:Uncharacterized protein n=1 Tax=Clonostachys rhizophaga TaxID=160324 RepID=A0A9N9YUY0_9HYPO|nr:unnamed protein product [Clonostachys rhizophaga]
MQPTQPQVAVTPAEVKPNDGPVKSVYDKLFNLAVGRWIVSVINLGLAAGILSKKPGEKMFVAAAYNIAVGGLHILLIFGPWIGPRARNSPLPPRWYYILIAISTPLWLSALIVMFVFRESDGKYEIINRRSLWGGLKDIAGNTITILENISIACGCMGVCAILFNIIQCYYIFKLQRAKFSAEELEEGYVQVNEPKDKSKDEAIKTG